jgi:hypothetical protein
LRIARARAVEDDFLADLRAWLEGCCQTDSQVRETLVRWVPEYTPAKAETRHGENRQLSTG